MPENDTTRNDYAKYRIDRTKEDLETAHLLFEAGKYRIANNRAYYASFHALRAILVFNDFDSSKHSSVIAEFRRRYIKEGIFPTETSKMIGQAFTIRMLLIMTTCFLQVNQILRNKFQMPIMYMN